MAKDRKSRKAQMDVGEFLLAQAGQEAEVGMKTLEMFGQGIRFITETVVVPLLPALIENIQAETQETLSRVELHKAEAKAARKTAKAARKAARRPLRPARPPKDNGG